MELTSDANTLVKRLLAVSFFVSNKFHFVVLSMTSMIVID